MPISSLPIAAALVQMALGTAALPQATAHQVSLDREDALTALGTAVNAPEGGRVSFTIQQAAISDRPISASCNIKAGRFASSNGAIQKQPRAIVCRFSEAGRWLPVRLELQSSAVRRMDSDGSNAMRGELSYGRLRFAVSPLATGFASGGPTSNRYLFTIDEAPAVNVAIGEKSSVRVAQGVDASGVRAILLAAAAMTVLSPSAG
ncbi:hypothetical protein SOQ14_00365 [Erythrobacter sp. T5W1-R]|uniref:hypothetical protein n=1 Tax=Erythrobacter sp. T5W1-R TaxID=3101752 RepID=UPI002AFF3D73|nr:hypothetical protein [Erythrobacter sp. T5W1-R]MEA1617365.1 hypothetical protein [Erythrobacter sp. T5W1-R]